MENTTSNYGQVNIVCLQNLEILRIIQIQWKVLEFQIKKHSFLLKSNKNFKTNNKYETIYNINHFEIDISDIYRERNFFGIFFAKNKKELRKLKIKSGMRNLWVNSHFSKIKKLLFSF